MNDIIEIFIIVLALPLSIVLVLFALFFWSVVVTFIDGLFFEIKRITKLSINDFKLDNDYYRDVLKTYNPAVLNFVDEFIVDPEKTLPLILLDLEFKGIIKLNSITKTIKKLEKFPELSLSEKYVFEQIKEGKVRNIWFSTLEDFVIEDVLKYKLVTKDESKELDMTTPIIMRIMIIVLCISAFLMLAFIFIENSVFSEIIFEVFKISTIIVCGYFVWQLIYFTFWASKEVINDKLGYTRTSKGKRLNSKIDGLRTFLKDYSLLDEKDLKSKEIWKEYLIYSIMFNQNKQALDELKEYFEP